MARRSNLSIRAAVMNCLARCAESEAPLCCLGQFLEKLGAMGWEPEDVFAVERAVLHLLGRLHDHNSNSYVPPELQLPPAHTDPPPTSPTGHISP